VKDIRQKIEQIYFLEITLFIHCRGITMRIFKDDPADTNGKKIGFMSKIIGEMLNFEVGKEVFRNGVRYRTDKPASYPSFTVDGVRTTISTNYGVIYAPNSLDLPEFAKYLKEEIVAASEDLVRDLKANYEQRYAALETGSDHFTVLKAKNSSHGTSIAKYVYDDIIRRIYVTDGTERLEKIIGARFVWIICPLEILIDNVENYISPRLPITSQWFSIVYDKYDMLVHPNNTQLEDNLTFRDFRACHNVKSITSWGTIPEDFETMDIEKWPEKYRDSVKLAQENYKNNKCYPEFVPGFEYSDWEIRLCPKRQGRLEIIRHLGNFTPYARIYNFPITPLERDVYEVSYHDIRINNSPAESDVCRFCRTPLYDDVYAVFSNASSNECQVYCPVCMHAKFDADGNYQVDGTPLYRETDIIGRFKHNRKVDEVIDTITFTTDGEIIKDILKHSFRGELTLDAANNSIYRALIFGYTPNCNPESIKYIAWNGPLGKYAQYAHNPSQFLTRVAGQKMTDKVMQHTAVFHAFIYNA
jgi:hypothetical protein